MLLTAFATLVLTAAPTPADAYPAPTHLHLAVVPSLSSELLLSTAEPPVASVNPAAPGAGPYVLQGVLGAVGMGLFGAGGAALGFFAGSYLAGTFSYDLLVPMAVAGAVAGAPLGVWAASAACGLEGDYLRAQVLSLIGAIPFVFFTSVQPIGHRSASSFRTNLAFGLAIGGALTLAGAILGFDSKPAGAGPRVMPLIAPSQGGAQLGLAGVF